MKNKGFTLVELLTIIVILALIILTALPKVLSIVNGSANKSWKSNVKLLRNTIQENSQLYNSKTGKYKYTVEDFCNDPEKLKKVADFSDVSINCSDNLFVLTGIGRYDGKTGKIMCNDTQCDSCITKNCTITTIKMPPKREDKTIATSILKNNTNVLSSPNLKAIDPTFKQAYVASIGSESSKSLNIATKLYNYTYSSSYTLDPKTGKFTLNSADTCRYSSCYSSLKGKYIVSTSGKITGKADSDNLSTIYLVTSNSTSSKLYYKPVTSVLGNSNEVDTSKSGMYSMSVTGGFSGGVSGTTYYYRGKVDNNYLSFAGLTWRIVRINEDRSIRIVLNDTISSSDRVYNPNYSELGSVYYSNSTAKTVLEEWYDTNIGNNDLIKNKVASGYYFCEAAKVKSTSNATIGSANLTLYSSYTPNLVCATDGNGKGLVNAKIGLLTLDEVWLAGGYPLTTNSNFYLYINNYFAIMTPEMYKNNTAYVWHLTHDGNLSGESTDNSVLKLRPVINLKSSVSITGSGTLSDPYIVN